MLDNMDDSIEEHSSRWDYNITKYINTEPSEALTTPTKNTPLLKRM